MQQPSEIVFRDIPRSEAIESKIRERIAKLEQFSSDIVGCRVVVELPHRRSNKGQRYNVTIHLQVPDDDIRITKQPGSNPAHEDVYVAIRDAFNAAERQLKSYHARRRGDVKNHEIGPVGTVDRIAWGEDYGFITTPDGRHIYFHRNALINHDFEDLIVGVDVRFVEVDGEAGPQASTVEVMGLNQIPPGKASQQM